MSRILDTVLPGFNFYVGFLEEGDTLSLLDIAGLFLGGFSEVTGLDSTMTILTLAEGGVNDRVHRLPGRFEVSNITLTKGVSFTDDLWNWIEGWQKGEGKRSNSPFEIVLIIAVALGLALGIQAFLVKPYRIPSESMVPTMERSSA